MKIPSEAVIDAWLSLPDPYKATLEVCESIGRAGDLLFFRVGFRRRRTRYRAVGPWVHLDFYSPTLTREVYEWCRLHPGATYPPIWEVATWDLVTEHIA